jgi:hypothetical protein
MSNKFNQDIGFTLNSIEVIDIYGADCHTAYASQESAIASADPQGKYEVCNPRTGYGAAIAEVEHIGEPSNRIECGYMVELRTPAQVVVLVWEGSSERAEIEQSRQQAHEAFVKVCALIGLRVGYQLTVLDKHPLLHLK